MALLVAPYLVALTRRSGARPMICAPRRSLTRDQPTASEGAPLKLLLTSAGIKNPSIQDALVELLGKPIAECDALCIPTALVRASLRRPSPGVAVHQRTGDRHARRSDWAGSRWECSSSPRCRASTTERWVPLVRGDRRPARRGRRRRLPVPLACGESGLADLLPSLPETVWVGVSGGSMVMTPRIGEDFVIWNPPAAGDRSAGDRRLLDLPAPRQPGPAGEHDGRRRTVGRRACRGPAYAIDDETAIKVVDGTVEVVSEGHWKLLALTARPSRRELGFAAEPPRRGTTPA